MSNYFVNGTALTSIFKANYSGTTQPNTNMKDDSGNDLSALFEPQSGSASQINYNTNYSAPTLGDLRYWFMNINYVPPFSITASGYNTNVSVNITGSTTSSTSGILVFTQPGTSGNFKVTSNPNGIYFTVIVVGGGGGGGGASSGGGGGGGGGGGITTAFGWSAVNGVNYNVKIGNGGGGGVGIPTASQSGGDGGNSTFSTITSNGGTGGTGAQGTNGASGGSGGTGETGNGGNGGSGSASAQNTAQNGSNSQWPSQDFGSSCIVNEANHFGINCGGGGGGGCAWTKDLQSNPQWKNGGKYGGGAGGATVNSGGDRSGGNATLHIDSWLQQTTNNVTVNYLIGGAGGGGASGYNGTYNGGTGSSGIVMIAWG